MNTKAMVPLALAVVLGLTAAFLVRTAMSHKQTVAVGPNNMVAVAVLRVDADPGHALQPEDLTVAKLPAESLPSGVFSDPAQLVGRVTTVSLVRGQTVLETLLAPTGTGSGLAALVPAGMRAVTVEVTEVTGVAGMLEPGCHVDVLSVMQDTSKKGGSLARTVLQNIKVQAIGHNIVPVHPQPGQPTPPPSNSVTLLVTPRQAQMLQLASNTGRPCLVLRSGRDGVEVPLTNTTLADLQGSPAGPGDGSEPTDPTGIADANSAPAAVIPAVAQSISPTTNPSAAAGQSTAEATPAIPAYIRRTCTVLNGEAETQVTVMVPNPRATVVNISDPADH